MIEILGHTVNIDIFVGIFGAGILIGLSIAILASMARKSKPRLPTRQTALRDPWSVNASDSGKWRKENS